jgi:tetratricopeptide (TPR) repeat protein
LLTGTLRGDAAFRGIESAQATPQQSELKYEGIPLVCYVEAAKAIPNSEQGNFERFNLLSGVATQYLKSGQPDNAIEIATSLESANAADALLTVLVAQQMFLIPSENTTEKLRIAFQLAQTMRGKSNRVQALLKIAEAAVQAGQPDLALQAIALAEQDAQTLEEAYSLVRIAANYVAAGQPSQAVQVLPRSEQIVRKISKPDERLTKLGWVAGRYAAAGQSDKASAILAPVLKTLNSLEYSNRRNTLLARLTAHYGLFGERQTLPGALELVQAIADAGQRDWALTRLWQSYQSAEHYDLALQTANTIKDSERKTNALTEIAQGYQAKGEEEKATQLLAQAFQVARTIPDPDRQFSALFRLVLFYSYSPFKQKDKVVEILDQVQPLVTKFPDTVKQLYTLDSIANSYAHIGQKDKASAVLEQVLTLANRIQDASTKEAAFRQIASSYALLDQFDQAIAIANRFQDASTKAKILNGIALTYLAQQPEKSLEIVKRIEPLDSKLANEALIHIVRAYATKQEFDQASQVVERIEDHDLVNWARVIIATEYAKAGQLDQALRVADTIQIKMQPATSNPSSNNDINSTEARLKNQTLSALALVYSQAERFPQALQVAQILQPIALKDQVLIAIAKQQAKAGQYSHAIQVAKTINAARQRDPLLQLLTCSNSSSTAASRSHFQSIIE